MRKIKDLVTVQFETLFTLFPIDDERYELITALNAITRKRENESEGDRWAVEDPRVNQAVLDTIATFAISARALAAISCHPNAKHSSITRERADRCEATVGRIAYRSALIAGDEYGIELTLVNCLLRSLVTMFLSDLGSKLVSKGQGGIP